MDMTLDLVDLDQKPCRVEVMIRRDTVELHHRRRLVGSMVREVLRAYMSAPIGAFTYDDTQWIEHNGAVWLCIRNQVAQPLTEPQLDALRRQL